MKVFCHFSSSPSHHVPAGLHIPNNRLGPPGGAEQSSGCARCSQGLLRFLHSPQQVHSTAQEGGKAFSTPLEMLPQTRGFLARKLESSGGLCDSGALTADILLQIIAKNQMPVKQDGKCLLGKEIPMPLMKS